MDRMLDKDRYRASLEIDQMKGGQIFRKMKIMLDEMILLKSRQMGRKRAR